jgi:hypothetical protein
MHKQKAVGDVRTRSLEEQQREVVMRLLLSEARTYIRCTGVDKPPFSTWADDWVRQADMLLDREAPK